jgi:hypothetical protein
VVSDSPAEWGNVVRLMLCLALEGPRDGRSRRKGGGYAKIEKMCLARDGWASWAYWRRAYPERWRDAV